MKERWQKTNTEALWEALLKHPSLEEVHRFYKFLMSCAKFSLHLHACDGVSSNDRFFAHYVDQNTDFLVDRMLCRNHQTNLVMVALYACISSGLLNDLYCASKFLRMGPFYFRCIVCLSRFVTEHFRMRVGTPSRVDTDFADEMRDYLKSAHSERGAHSEDYRKTGKRKKRGGQNFEASIDAHFRFFNGGYPTVGEGEALDVSEQKVFHICPGPHCCRSPSASAVRARKHLCILLQHKPKSPEQGKWTKVGPCLDFWQWGMLNFVFANLLKCATRASSRYRQGDGRDGGEPEAVPEGADAARSDFTRLLDCITGELRR